MCFLSIQCYCEQLRLSQVLWSVVSSQESIDAYWLLATHVKNILSILVLAHKANLFTWAACVINMLEKLAYVISEQDVRHKLTFLQKGTRHFVTPNNWTWQWIRMETIYYEHPSDEIWELNSHGCAISVPNLQGPLKSPFCYAVQKRWVN